MARVTVEDCLEFVENRFALVHATSKRVNQMFDGSQALIACDNREIVTALREIADSNVAISNETVEEEDSKPSKRKTSKK